MNTAETKVLFFGTPSFSVPVLRVLIESGYTILCVTSVHDSPIKGLATSNGVEVLQPESFDESIIAKLQAFAPDVAVLAAYGKILREPVLAIPTHGFVNVHPSLLPKYRGSSPVINTILSGETTTGVSIFVMDRGVDTGPILGQVKRPLNGVEHAGTLTETLFQEGADLLKNLLPQYLTRKLTPTPQDDAQATVTRKIPKETAVIDWNALDTVIERQVRAYDPWPMARTIIGGLQIQLLEVKVTNKESSLAAGSTITLEDEHRIGMVCGNKKILIIESARPQDKQTLSGEEFYNGYRGSIQSS